uniref:PH domain-containing protein n=1 Tax=Steinernema glaseri TaxID=37863 RepID=A0A1I7YAF1_9BILA
MPPRAKREGKKKAVSPPVSTVSHPLSAPFRLHLPTALVEKLAESFTRSVIPREREEAEILSDYVAVRFATGTEEERAQWRTRIPELVALYSR